MDQEKEIRRKLREQLAIQGMKETVMVALVDDVEYSSSEGLFDSAFSWLRVKVIPPKQEFLVDGKYYAIEPFWLECLESARDSLGLQRISPQKIRDMEMQLPRQAVRLELEPTEVWERESGSYLSCKVTLRTAIKASWTEWNSAGFWGNESELTLTGTGSFKEVE